MTGLVQMIVVFALILGAMVIIHEFGHFIVARLFGVRVEVFSVGFGTRLWGVRRGDTDYRISLIPLGGYVKMAGENLDEKITGAPDEFMSKPKWQRFFVALAGPGMNILTALAIPAAIGMIHYEMPAFLTKPAIINAVQPGSSAEKAGLQRGDLIVRIGDEQNPTWSDVQDLVSLSPDQDVPITVLRGNETIRLALRPAISKFEQEKLGEAGFFPDYGPNARLIVKDVTPGSPAAEAGLKAGDQIIGVNGAPVEQSPFGHGEVIRTIRTSNGQPVTLTVKRGEQTLDIRATPRLEGGDYLLGFHQTPQDIETIATRLSPASAIKHSVEWNLRTLRLTRTALVQVFAGKRSVRDTFTGPVGILVLSGQAAEQGIGPVFELMAILSLNLGAINLLPIPVLDGGLIFMLVLEGLLGLFGLPLTLKIKERMMQIGFVVILLLMAFVIFNDISKQLPARGAAQQVEQQKPPSDK